MRDIIEQVIKKNLPENMETCTCEEDIGYHTEECNFFPFGFNDCLSQINTSLIADEVLKVVVKTKIFEEILEYIRNTEEKIDGEWGRCRDFIELERDKEVPKLYYKVKDLLSSLSPNNENK